VTEVAENGAAPMPTNIEAAEKRGDRMKQSLHDHSRTPQGLSSQLVRILELPWEEARAILVEVIARLLDERPSGSQREPS
jgi:hypothetical protein